MAECSLSCHIFLFKLNVLLNKKKSIVQLNKYKKEEMDNHSDVELIKMPWGNDIATIIREYIGVDASTQGPDAASNDGAAQPSSSSKCTTD